ncbi:hypothetical protein ENT52713_42650 [Enterobacter sp. 200527-13]|nr:hypothetical protein NMCA_39970 [Enterobacter ludwigii]GLH26869.1 hypothetical protein ENT52713_42650 [Enterobacter sp. 200527-13]
MTCLNIQYWNAFSDSLCNNVEFARDFGTDYATMQIAAWKWYTRAFTLLRNVFRRHEHGQQRRKQGDSRR